jgi:hypothetical protein
VSVTRSYTYIYICMYKQMANLTNITRNPHISNYTANECMYTYMYLYIRVYEYLMYVHV